MKKLVSLLLILSMVMSLGINSLGNETESFIVNGAEITIIQDNDNVTVVKEVNENSYTIATNYKSERIITKEVFDLDNNLIESQEINLNTVVNEFKTKNKLIADMLMSYDSWEDDGFELIQKSKSTCKVDYYLYETKSGNRVWDCLLPNEKKRRWQTDDNKELLYEFRRLAEKIDSKETLACTLVGIAGVAEFAATFFTGGAAVAIALFGGSLAVSTIYELFGLADLLDEVKAVYLDL